jgi:hypothetical protein
MSVTAFLIVIIYKFFPETKGESDHFLPRHVFDQRVADLIPTGVPLEQMGALFGDEVAESEPLPESYNLSPEDGRKISDMELKMSESRTS